MAHITFSHLCAVSLRVFWIYILCWRWVCSTNWHRNLWKQLFLHLK